MRTVGTTLAIVLGMGFVVVVMTGARGGLGIPLPLLLLVALAGLLLFRGRSVRTVEVGWSGASPVTTPISALPVVPASAPRTGRGSVARSLARVEARELIASPWFAAGIALWVVVIAVVAVVFGEDLSHSWWEAFFLVSMFAHPFAGLAIVAAHRNRTRSVRHGCDELFDTCPADADARSLGHLLTAWVGAAVSCVAVVVLLLLAAWRAHSYGPIDGEMVAAVLTVTVIGAGAVLFGATLGRWMRWQLVPFAAVVAVPIVGARLARIGEPGWSTDRMLSTFVPTLGVDTLFFTRPVWARLGWLLSLSVLVGALGLIGRRRAATAVVGVATAAAFVAAVVVVQPASEAAADRITERVVEPLNASSCQRAGPNTRVCAYREYGELRARVTAAVAPVTAAVPRGAMADVTFLTHFPGRGRELQSEVRAAMAARPFVPPAGTLRLRFDAHPENLVAARLRLAAHAVGLPTEAGPADVPTVVAGQSRGVVVLWLATRGLDRDDTLRLLKEGRREPDFETDDTDRGAVWPAICRDEVGVLQWSPTDLTAARRLVQLPSAAVQSLLDREWTRLTAPGATVDDLMRAAGLAAVGPAVPVKARPFRC